MRKFLDPLQRRFKNPESKIIREPTPGTSLVDSQVDLPFGSSKAPPILRPIHAPVPPPSFVTSTKPAAIQLPQYPKFSTTVFPPSATSSNGQAPCPLPQKPSRPGQSHVSRRDFSTTTTLEEQVRRNFPEHGASPETALAERIMKAYLGRIEHFTANGLRLTPTPPKQIMQSYAEDLAQHLIRYGAASLPPQMLDRELRKYAEWIEQCLAKNGISQNAILAETIRAGRETRSYVTLALERLKEIGIEGQDYITDQPIQSYAEKEEHRLLDAGFWPKPNLAERVVHSYDDPCMEEKADDEISPGPPIPRLVQKRCREALAGWKLTHHPIEEFTTLPTKIDPQDIEKYIGSEVKDRPKWLWDSHTGATVLAKDYIFKEGYVAVSYTWGRWRQGKNGWYRESGTEWDVPSILPHKLENKDQPVCNFRMAQLKNILRRMPNVRYFWIDVLCIPQQDGHPDKASEIAKQPAIFKDAKGVLVYLWSIDDGTQLRAAMQDLSDMLRWYWNIIVSHNGSAPNQANDRRPCLDTFGETLRRDPWFSSLWTVQEMILAPASTWIARDGSHCRVDGSILTTHTVAKKLEDISIREEFYDPLCCRSNNASRHYVLSKIPKTEGKSKRIIREWYDWAFGDACIMVTTSKSRAYTLQTAVKRTYTGRRELAVLAPLRVGNDSGYEKETKAIDGIPVTLWNKLIRADGGRLFHNSHSEVLTNMLPTTADIVIGFGGIGVNCSGWQMRDNGELIIAPGSKISRLPNAIEKAQYQFCDETICGGDPEQTVKKYLLRKGIKVKHVRFVLLGVQSPSKPVPKESLEWEGTKNKWAGVRGTILVTNSENIRSKTCLWDKTGNYYATDYEDECLDHGIIVRA
ncbi:hypothetical protein B0J14DRAFT_14422 [Halenospora varia]|nr:hypothetical protein B0J14DRAFT_14422 [Halenospora varia]